MLVMYILLDFRIKMQETPTKFKHLKTYILIEFTMEREGEHHTTIDSSLL
jgi:hypothetical protein